MARSKSSCRTVPSGVLDEPGHIVITTSRDEFARAVRLHQAGDLDAAARLYEWVLDDDRSHADALHLLGMLRHQQGQTSSGRRVDRQGRGLAARTWPSSTPRWPRCIVPSASSKKPSPAVVRRFGSGSTTPPPATTWGWPCTSWGATSRRPARSWRCWNRDPTTRWPTPIWARPCANWATNPGRSNT